MSHPGNTYSSITLDDSNFSAPTYDSLVEADYMGEACTLTGLRPSAT